MDEVADSNSVAPTIFKPVDLRNRRAFLCRVCQFEFSSTMEDVVAVLLGTNSVAPTIFKPVDFRNRRAFLCVEATLLSL